MNILKNVWRQIYRSHLYISKIKSHIKNSRFREASDEILTGIRRDKEGIFRVNIGEGRNDAVIYLLQFRQHSVGFYGFYRKVINQLAVADRMGWIPVVSVDSEWIYLNGDVNNNPFCWLFEQPAGVELEDISKYATVVEGSGIHQPIGMYGHSSGYDNRKDVDLIERQAYIEEKYIHERGEISKRVQNDIAALMTARGIDPMTVLGVHARGSDYNVGYVNHPTAVSAKDYISQIDIALKEQKYEYVFLATEDENIKEAIIDAFKDKVLTFDDVFRTRNLIWQESDRNDHGIKLMYEVYRDVQTLSCCGGFIGNLSNVSMGVRIARKRKRMDTVNDVIIDRGVNASGMTESLQNTKKYSGIGNEH